MKNKLGILCHVSSLPSKYGIGDFGTASKNFIDLLSENNIYLWQILPLNKTNEFNCPYGSLCYFALDEMFVSPDDLLNQKLIEKKHLKNLLKLKNSKRVCYAKVKEEKLKLFDIAFANFPKEKLSSIEKFSKTHPKIKNYAIFVTLLKTFGVYDWRELPKEFVDKDATALNNFAKKHKEEIGKQIFIQYILNTQWKSVLQYARKKNIKILGDLPIYPDKKSFEVFYSPGKYKLNNKTLLPAVTGGVPADCFCAEGQDWGTCIYNWKEIQKENFEYLIDKIKDILSLCDILRLDHVAGYVEHFENNPTTPSKSKWVKEGGKAFFEALEKKIPLKHFVIEDLGIISKACQEVKDNFSLTGMKVLQFALELESHSTNNDFCNDISYLGTHDNNTFVGYLNELPTQKKQALCDLLQIENKSNKQIAIDCIRKLLDKKSKFVVLQLQDLLLQNSKQRMNIPGQAENCWEYRAPYNIEKLFKKNLRKIMK